MKDYKNWTKSGLPPEFNYRNYPHGRYQTRPAIETLVSPVITKFYRGIKFEYKEVVGINSKKHIKYVLISVNNKKNTNGEFCHLAKKRIDEAFEILNDRILKEEKTAVNDEGFNKAIKAIKESKDKSIVSIAMDSLLINNRYNENQKNWVIKYLVENMNVELSTIYKIVYR